jgi:hypothetical protein
MTIRANSLEAAAAIISTVSGATLLIETSNQGGSRRYKVMDALGEGIVDELHFRDAAITSPGTIEAVTAKIAEIEAAFEEEAGTCFATRISTFENGALIDVILFGQDYFCKFED